MRRFTTPLIALAMLALATPALAQGGNISLAYFVTASDQDVPDLEAGIREHNEWHARQGDTWTWVVYEAITGDVPEYVYASLGHSWADLDSPTVDLRADSENWAETGGEHSRRTTSNIWRNLPDISRPRDSDEPPPIVLVIEFRIRSDSEQEITHAATKFKAAVEGANVPIYYNWYAVDSSDEPPTWFVAIPFNDFASLDGFGDEDPFAALMRGVYGEVEADQIAELFEENMRPISNRMWVFRPDLSYLPEQ